MRLFLVESKRIQANKNQYHLMILLQMCDSTMAFIGIESKLGILRNDHRKSGGHYEKWQDDTRN